MSSSINSKLLPVTLINLKEINEEQCFSFWEFNYAT